MKAIKKLIEDATKRDSLDNLSREQLCKLVNDIYAKAEEAEDFTTLEVEAVQDITINCYEELGRYKNNHVETLVEIRRWAKEFEKWWQSMDEEEREKKGYLESIDKFCGRKMRTYRYEEIRGKLSEVQATMARWRCTTDADNKFMDYIYDAINLIMKEE